MNLVREAHERGCVVLVGYGMLLSQGIVGIRLWSRLDPRPEVMRRSLEDVLATTDEPHQPRSQEGVAP
jgi:shikimate 5-dehydrogenase